MLGEERLFESMRVGSGYDLRQWVLVVLIARHHVHLGHVRDYLGIIGYLLGLVLTVSITVIDVILTTLLLTCGSRVHIDTTI